MTISCVPTCCTCLSYHYFIILHSLYSLRHSIFDRWTWLDLVGMISRFPTTILHINAEHLAATFFTHTLPYCAPARFPRAHTLHAHTAHAHTHFRRTRTLRITHPTRTHAPHYTHTTPTPRPPHRAPHTHTHPTSRTRHNVTSPFISYHRLLYAHLPRYSTSSPFIAAYTRGSSPLP